MKYTDEEIKNLAGHPDLIPEQYREWFLKGYRKCEELLKIENDLKSNIIKDLEKDLVKKEDIINNIVKKFEEEFEDQKLQDDLNEEEVKDLIVNISNHLNSVLPDELFLDYIDYQSVFFILKKQNTTIHIHHFFSELKDYDHIAIFDDGLCINSFDDNLENILKYIKKIFET